MGQIGILKWETTLQGVRNARDTILWRLEASAFELKMVLDEREATQRASPGWIVNSMSSTRRPRKTLAVSETGAWVGALARAKVTTKTRKVRRRKSSTSSTSSRAGASALKISFSL